MSDSHPVSSLGDLTDREHQLVDAARRGDWFMCSHLGVDELAASGDPDHHIRAGLIRELLLGRRGELDPRGLQLAGARIIDELDLSYERRDDHDRVQGFVGEVDVVPRGERSVEFDRDRGRAGAPWRATVQGVGNFAASAVGGLLCTVTSPDRGVRLLGRLAAHRAGHSDVGCAVAACGCKPRPPSRLTLFSNTCAPFRATWRPWSPVARKS